jgi:hypothetical protein
MPSNVFNRVTQTTTVKDHLSYLTKIRDDASFKAAYGWTVYQTLYFNQESSKHSHLKICKESISTFPTVIYTQKDFHLTDAMNIGLELFKSAGLIDFWRSKDLEKRSSTDTEQDAKSLTMDQLLGSFMVLLFGCVLSFVVLTIELVRVKFTVKSRKHFNDTHL